METGVLWGEFVDGDHITHDIVDGDHITHDIVDRDHITHDIVVGEGSQIFRNSGGSKFYGWATPTGAMVH